MEDFFTVYVSDVLNTLYSVDETGTLEDDSEDEEYDEEEKENSNNEYTKRFQIPVFRVKEAYEDGLSYESIKDYDRVFSTDIDTDLLQNTEPPEGVVYETNSVLMAAAENSFEKEQHPELQNHQKNERLSYTEDMVTIEYESPELLNGQKTYQRIVFQADKDGENVYELTVRKLREGGMQVLVEYDGTFDSMLFTSINRRKEGEDGNFNEFYLNGEIGDNAIDKQLLMSGDVIEWRYAEETDGSCGGVPDFGYIKSLLEYNAAFRKGYATPFGSNPLLFAA